MVTLVPIMSGLASGFLGGIFTVEIRARREQRLKEKQWYNRTMRMAERINRSNFSGSGVSDALYARNACAGVLGNLSTHITEAPSCVSEKMLEASETLAMRIQTIQGISPHEVHGDPKQVKKSMGPTAEEARRVVEIAREERESVDRI